MGARRLPREEASTPALCIAAIIAADMLDRRCSGRTCGAGGGSGRDRRRACRASLCPETVQYAAYVPASNAGTLRTTVVPGSIRRWRTSCRPRRPRTCAGLAHVHHVEVDRLARRYRDGRWIDLELAQHDLDRRGGGRRLFLACPRLHLPRCTTRSRPRARSRCSTAPISERTSSSSLLLRWRISVLPKYRRDRRTPQGG